MLNSTTTRMLKEACPTTKLIPAGVYAARNTSNGNTSHHSHGNAPVIPTNGTAISTPTAVPPSASTALRPAAETLPRSAESVPRTAQKAKGAARGDVPARDREPPQNDPEGE